MSEEQVRFLMLIGLPASGKSTFAKGLIGERGDILYLSSDVIREELYGDESIQGDNKLIFELMESRTKEALNNGYHVVYDATNLSRKKRSHLLRQLPRGTFKTAVYMSTDYEIVQMQNKERDRVVPENIIDNMYKNLQVPIYSEGWDDIVFEYHDEILNGETPKQFRDAVRVGVLLGREGYELMEFLATYFKPFFSILDMSQDSKYHCFSVSRHTYYVYKHILDNYQTEDDNDKEIILWTALLHDTGKHFCKSFMSRKGEETRYANFIGHEHVGSQIAVSFLKKFGFNDSFIHEVATLIQFHMYLLDKNANKEKLKNRVGEEIYKKLEILRDADTLSH